MIRRLSMRALCYLRKRGLSFKSDPRRATYKIRKLLAKRGFLPLSPKHVVRIVSVLIDLRRTTSTRASVW
jgi:hypothetical protein